MVEDLKIRASSLGKIMSDDSSTKITDKQLVTLNGLLTKIKLTEKQAKQRDELVAKRDANPQLSIGAKSYIKELWLEKEFGVKKEIKSKYLDKGNEVEDASIDLCKVLLKDDSLYKNDLYFENDYLTGTPDIKTMKTLIDVKSSWSAATFPFFDTYLKNKMYEWQLKAYMYLCNIKESKLIYCLVRTPEDLILDEIRRTSWNRLEGSEISEETEKEVRDYFDISAIPLEKRIKVFDVYLTEADVKKIKEKVELAREYYDSLS